MKRSTTTAVAAAALLAVISLLQQQPLCEAHRDDTDLVLELWRDETSDHHGQHVAFHAQGRCADEDGTTSRRVLAAEFTGSCIVCADDTATSNDVDPEIIPEEMKYIHAFHRTGCPNPAPLIDHWMSLGDAHTWASMHQYCALTMEGRATEVQRRQCCGAGVECVPTACALLAEWPEPAAVEPTEASASPTTTTPRAESWVTECCPVPSQPASTDKLLAICVDFCAAHAGGCRAFEMMEHMPTTEGAPLFDTFLTPAGCFLYEAPMSGGDGSDGSLCYSSIDHDDDESAGEQEEGKEGSFTMCAADITALLDIFSDHQRTLEEWCLSGWQLYIAFGGGSALLLLIFVALVRRCRRRGCFGCCCCCCCCASAGARAEVSEDTSVRFRTFSLAPRDPVTIKTDPAVSGVGFV